MFNFVHSCLSKNFIKLGGVLSCVMALNIIFFHNCNHILADEADNTLVMWDDKIFRATFTVVNFLHRQFFVSWLPTFYSPRNHNKITIYSCEISKTKSDAFNKQSRSSLLYSSIAVI